MKYTVTYKDKEYEVHAHASVLLGDSPVEEYVSSYIKKGIFYETPLLTYVEENFGLIDVAIDCGANIGNHSKFFSEVLGAEVWSFEPSEENYRLLVRNNPMGHNYRAALGDKKGSTGLEEFPHNMGASRLVPGKSIEVMTIDQFKIKPDLIKVDVEGMEAEVLRGALKTIEKYRPILLVEHNDIQALYETSRVLKGLDYKMEVFSEKNWELFIYTQND